MVFVIAFLRRSLITLDDIRLPCIQYFSRADLHRCLQQHRASRLAHGSGDSAKRQKFKRHPVCARHSLDPAVFRPFFHTLIAEAQTAEVEG